MYPTTHPASRDAGRRDVDLSPTLPGTIDPRELPSRRSVPVSATRLGGVALLGAIVLLGPLPLPGQEPGVEDADDTGGVSGTVISAETGERLSGVQVRVPEASLRSVTDERGRFVLGKVPEGEITLTTDRIGYQSSERTVDVKAGEMTTIEWALEPEALAVAGITVSAAREARRLSETAASIGIVDGGIIRSVRAGHPSEILDRIPGVHVNVTGGEGHMTAIRQPLTTDPVYLFLEDGVPTRSTGFFNHNALYEVNLPQADGVEVIKGPGTALYGSDAVGGVVDVRTRSATAEPELEVSAEGGAFGWRRLMVSASGSPAGDGLRADLNATASDGWRDATAYERQSGTLRWERSLAGGSNLLTVATFSRVEQETAGTSPLPEELFRAGSSANLAPISFRSVRAFRLYSRWESTEEGTVWSITPFLRHNRMDLLPDWALTFDPAIWETENSSVGLRARVRRELPWWETRLTAGVDVDYSPGNRYERAIEPQRDDRTFVDFASGEVLYDYDVAFREMAPYMDLTAAPAEGLHLSAGLRADFLSYDYETALEPLQEGSHRRPPDARVSYRSLTPKLGATYDVGRDLNVFASYRQGFRAPSESQLFRQGTAVSTVDLDPVRVHSFEVGLRGRMARWISYEVTGYAMPKVDDIVAFTLPDGNRETQNAGETLHRGVEVGLGVEPWEGIRMDVAYAYASHTYERWEPREGLDLSGNEMEFAPRETGNVELSVSPPALRGARLALGWSRVGRYWMDPENTAAYEGHDLLNLRAEAPLPGNVAAFARLMNVTNERFAERAQFSQFRGAEFAPGRPRALFVGLEWTGGL